MTMNLNIKHQQFYIIIILLYIIRNYSFSKIKIQYCLLIKYLIYIYLF